MKRLLFFVFGILTAFNTCAQIGEFANVRAIRLINGSASTAGTNPGVIYYNTTTNKFQFRQGSLWVELGSGGGTGVTDGDKGDITVSGTGATWLVDNASITLPKLQTIGPNTFLGRITAGTGIAEQLTTTQVTSMLNSFSRTLKGLAPPSGGTTGTVNFLREDGVWSAPPGTGGAGTGTTETASNGLTKVGDDIRMGGSITASTTVTLANSSPFKIQNQNDLSAIYNGSEYLLEAGFHFLSGDFVNKTGLWSDMYLNNQHGVIYNELANGENVKFEISAGATQSIFTDNRTAKRGIEYNAVDGGLSYVTQPGTLTPKIYVDNAIAGAINTGIANGDKGDITVSNSGATWLVDNDAITYAKLQNVAGLRFLGRVTNSSGNTEEITGTQATSMLSYFTRTLKGLTPPSGGTTGTVNFLREDGAWAAPPSGGTTPGVFTSTVNGLVPASGGGSDKYLASDATWKTFNALTTIGTINSQTKSANGAVVSGANLIMQTADATYPGLVSAGTQTFAGNKTFKNYIVIEKADGGISQQWVNDGGINNEYLGLYSYANDFLLVSSKNGTGVVKNLHFGMGGVDDIATSSKMVLSAAGNLGIGTTAPNAPLQFANALTSKIRLFEFANNEHQQTGFAVSNNGGGDGSLSYRVAGTSTDHVFYAGTSATTSQELMRITGTGIINLPIVPANDNTQTQVLVRNSTSGDVQYRTIATAPTFAEGSFTPTAFNLSANVNAVIPASAEYVRNGDRVTVSGGVYIDTTDGAIGSLTLSLPIASNFTNAMQGSGTVVGWPAAGYGTVFSDSTLDRIGIAIMPIDAANRLYYYHYTYKIQ